MDTSAETPSTTASGRASTLMGIMSSFSSFATRIFKGTLLAVWIVALLFLALFACSGRASDSILHFSTHFSTRVFSPANVVLVEPCLSPDGLLRAHLNGHKNPPPIALVLDTLLEKWNVTSDNCNPENRDQRDRYNRDVSEKYTFLFQKIERRLNSFAVGPAATDRPQAIDYTILPPEFRPRDAIDRVSLPPEVLAQVGVWASKERTSSEQRRGVAALIDTFLLLTVIGAFGSLIFLTRDYIQHEIKICIGTYVFRPMLGVFLAMAIFTLDVLAHAVISTASIIELRHEPLYVLALAAGLLSEQAYEVIKLRAEKVIENYKTSSDANKQLPANEQAAQNEKAATSQ